MALGLLLGWVLLPVSVSAMNAEACEVACIREFREAEASEADDAYHRLLERLLGLKEVCSGTGVYEARLSVAYSLAGNHGQALRVVESFRGVGKKYSGLLDLARLYAERYRGLDARPQAIQWEKALSLFVVGHGDNSEAWESLGYVRLLLGDFERATLALEKSLVAPLDPDRVNRDLTICYVHSGRYAEAIRALNKAYREGDWARYPTFALCSAGALMAFGKFNAAEAVLGEMLEAHPEARRDPNVAEAIRILAEGKARAAGRGP